MKNKTVDPRGSRAQARSSTRALLASLASLTVAIANTALAARADNGGMWLQGVNISGGEFNQQTVPGVYGTNYIYPSTAELDYFRSKGLNVIRVPFSWERMQPTANGPLDPKEVARLDAVVLACQSRGMFCVLDPHDYGAYFNVTVGVPGGQPNSMFANFWQRMAAHYINIPGVIYGLMNEPVGSTMTSATWAATAQAAINAIRSTGAKQLILVPSTYWEHPVNWVSLNASEMSKITDPANNFSYEVHQYLDYDGSGTHTDFLSVTDSIATLSGFTAWLKANHKTAFLGEIGVTSAPGALADLSAMLQYMHANSSAWTGFTYWTAGAWYPSNYIFLVEPQNGVDTPQMKTIMSNLGTTNISANSGTTSGTTSGGSTSGGGTSTGGTTSGGGTSGGSSTGGTTSGGGTSGGGTSTGGTTSGGGTSGGTSTGGTTSGGTSGGGTSTGSTTSGGTSGGGTSTGGTTSGDGTSGGGTSTGGTTSGGGTSGGTSTGGTTSGDSSSGGGTSTGGTTSGGGTGGGTSTGGTTSGGGTSGGGTSTGGTTSGGGTGGGASTGGTTSGGGTGGGASTGGTASGGGTSGGSSTGGTASGGGTSGGSASHGMVGGGGNSFGGLPNCMVGGGTSGGGSGGTAVRGGSDGSSGNADSSSGGSSGGGSSVREHSGGSFGPVSNGGFPQLSPQFNPAFIHFQPHFKIHYPKHRHH